jgi:hypothetical protein
VVHYAEGYTDIVHLGPALAGAALFLVSLTLEAVGHRQDETDQPGRMIRRTAVIKSSKRAV